jgi:type II secretory pathway pseudopilin PulG
MIRFFRQLRQSLLIKNRFSKYLLYALGEIALVMIGILLALQVNNWNEFQKDREIEKKALINLAENMELNINEIERKIARIQKDNKSGQIVLAAIQNNEQTIDTLGQHFHWALVNHSNLALSKAGYESLKNIGFEILRNEILKKEIVNLYENTYLQLSKSQKWG